MDNNNQQSTQNSNQTPPQPVTPPPSQNIPINNNPPSTPPPPQPTPNDHIPLQQPSEHNVGVGTPNIGVEEKTAPHAQPDKMPALAPIESENTQSIEPKNENTIEVEDANFQPVAPPNPIPAPPTPAPEPTPPSNTPVNQELLQVKNYQNPEPQNDPNAPKPPIKASHFNTSLMVLIIVALILGSAGGFFGFKYWDNLKTSASSEPTPTATVTPSLDVSTWQTYTSSLYNFLLKYPTGWQISSTDPQAEALVIAADKESLTSDPTGYKIEINFQNSNSKTLKQWVDANTTATGETKAAKEITISGVTAYQQELSKNGSKVATYIERPSKIMIVTYSAPESTFGQGGDWYNKLIDSIQLK